MERDEIKIGAFLSYVIISLSTIAGLLYTPYLLRQLGQSEYGLYMLIGSLIGYITVLDFGLHNTIYRFIAKYQAENDEENQENFLASCFIIYGLISVLILVVGAVVYLNLDVIFSQTLTADELFRAQIMFIILIINIAITIPLGAFQFIIKGYGKFTFANSVIIARILVRTLTMIGILYLGYKAIAIVILDSLFNIIVGLIYSFYSFKILHIKIKLHKFNKHLLKDMLRYSFYIFIIAIVNQLFWRIGHLTLGIIASTVAVAIYALSINLVIYYQKFALAISGVFMPRVAGLIAKGRSGEELTDLMIKVGRVQLSVLGLVLTGYIILGRQFVLLWAGEEYSLVFWVTVMIFIPLTVPMIQTLGEVILQAKNMHHFKAKAYLIMSLLNLMASIFLAKSFGPLGVGISVSASIIVFQIIVINFYYYYIIELNVLRFFKQTVQGLLPAILISLALGYLTLFLPGSGWTSLFYRVVLIIVTYIIIIYIIGFNQEEKRMFIQPLYSFLKIQKNISSNT